jgi:hypothetical protein
MVGLPSASCLYRGIDRCNLGTEEVTTERDRYDLILIDG